MCVVIVSQSKLNLVRKQQKQQTKNNLVHMQLTDWNHGSSRIMSINI